MGPLPPAWRQEVWNGALAARKIFLGPQSSKMRKDKKGGSELKNTPISLFLHLKRIQNNQRLINGRNLPP
jgi:hypothetical protein